MHAEYKSERYLCSLTRSLFLSSLLNAHIYAHVTSSTIQSDDVELIVQCTQWFAVCDFWGKKFMYINFLDIQDTHIAQSMLNSFTIINDKIVQFN